MKVVDYFFDIIEASDVCICISIDRPCMNQRTAKLKVLCPFPSMMAQLSRFYDNRVDAVHFISFLSPRFSSLRSLWL